MIKHVVTIALLLFFVGGFAQTEALFKSVFIYNFANMIDWPANYKTGDFVITVLGETPIYDELAKMSAVKKVGSQTIVVKKIKSASELSASQIVVVAESKTSELSGVIARIGDNSTLVVADKPGLVKSGAGISFALEAGKIRFELSKANTTKNGLKTSATLEKLAIISH